MDELKFFEEAVKKSKSGSTKLKLKEGESCYFALLGKPTIYYNDYENRAEYKMPTGNAKTRFKWNIALQQGDKWVLKILDQSISFGEKVLAMIREMGKDTIFKIERKGSGQFDTEYFLTPTRKTFDESISKDWELYDLTKYLQDPEESAVIKKVEDTFSVPDDLPYADSPAPTDEDIPF